MVPAGNNSLQIILKDKMGENLSGFSLKDPAHLIN